MEPKEVQKYMEHLVQLLRQQFGEQLLYVGLQGSCRRGEATENSDIDAVVVLEELSIPHLQQYRDGWDKRRKAAALSAAERNWQAGTLWKAV